ncbi:MAG: signal peptidase I [Candidatus Hydrothermarchaeaceae archaeon]
MDWKKETRETVFYIFIGLILAYVLNTGLGFALGTEKPVMAVVSGSMEPAFYKGDLVVVMGVPPESLKVGDVIVYENHFRRIDVVHRVIAIENKGPHFYFYTKGDNNPESDQKSGLAPPVINEWVGGKVVIVIPKLGWFKVVLTDFLVSQKF